MAAKRSHQIEVWFGWFLLIGTGIAAPVDVYLYLAGYIDTDNMILQTLVLSWAALTLTAWDVVKTSRAHRDIHEQQKS
jgi:hypothetical protein